MSEIENDIKKILKAGIQAPSGDNLQPWRFEVNNITVKIFNVPERDISIYNKTNYPSMFTHGAIIENMLTTARSLGYKTNVNIFPDKTDKNHTATLKFVKDTSSLNNYKEIIERIYKRHTNRKPYKKILLTENQKKMLFRIARPVGKNKLYILDYPQNEIASAASMNEQLVFQNYHMYKPFFDSVRWSNKEVIDTCDGFSIRTFELPLPGLLIFKLAKKWSRLENLNKFLKLAYKIPAQTKKIYESSGAFCAITAPSANIESYLETGRIMQRVWIEINHNGLSLQPIMGIILLKNVLDSKTSVPLSKEEKNIVNNSYKIIADNFEINSDEKILFMARIGHAKKPNFHTVRLPIEKVIHNK